MTYKIVWHPKLMYHNIKSQISLIIYIYIYIFIIFMKQRQYPSANSPLENLQQAQCIFSKICLKISFLLFYLLYYLRAFKAITSVLILYHYSIYYFYLSLYQFFSSLSFPNFNPNRQNPY